MFWIQLLGTIDDHGGYHWFRCYTPLVMLQSWRRQAYLLQVPHLLIHPVMKSSSEWRSVYSILLTGEPSINQFPVLLIEGKPSINGLLSFDLHMHGVTCFKLGSLILPTSLKTLGGIFAYSLPTFQSDIPEILEKETSFLHSLSHRRYKYRWKSIYQGVMVTF